MSRTLIRYVFPQFVFRLTIVVAIVAVAIYTYARSYRTGNVLDRIERETQVILAVIDSREFSSDTVRGLLSDLSAEAGVSFGIYGDRRLSFFSGEMDVHRFAQENAELFRSQEIERVEPSTSLSSYVGVVYPASIPAIPEATHLIAITDTSELTGGLRNLGFWLVVMVISFFVAIVSLSYRVVRSIQGPVGYLQTAANHFAEGDLTYRCDVPEPSELHRLAETMNSMAEQLTTRIDAIRAQRTQLESILASMTEGVVLLDDRFQISTMNDAALRLFRVESLTTPRGEPRTLLEVIRNSEIYEAVLKTFATGTNQEGTITVYTNPPRFMQVHSGIVDTGERNAVLLVFNDVTRMQELENIRKDFVANVSHELKTPITSILGFVETLTDGDAITETEEALRFLDIISAQAQRLNAIIEDLLQLSRLEQQHDGIVVENCRIEELVAGVKQSLEKKAFEKEITLVDEYHGNPRFTANPNLMEQAMTNLLDNAIKYCPPGSRVEIRFRRTPQSVRIEVADNGPGIPTEAQGRIFERFYRVDRARSRAVGGTGLGLAIVKHIAQAHGGSVALESVQGRGSTFVFEIPQAGSSRSPAAASTAG